MEEPHPRKVLAYPGPPHTAAGVAAATTQQTSQSTSPSSSVSTPSTQLSSSLCISADTLAHGIRHQNGSSPETSQSSQSDDSLVQKHLKGGAHVSQPGRMETVQNSAKLYFKQAQPVSMLVEDKKPISIDASSNIKTNSDHLQDPESNESYKVQHQDSKIVQNEEKVHHPPDLSSSSPSRSYHHPRRRKKRKEHRVDIAQYPTAQLLHLLAELLTQIATSNDRLRKKSSSPISTTASAYPSASNTAPPASPSNQSSLPNTTTSLSTSSSTCHSPQRSLSHPRPPPHLSSSSLSPPSSSSSPPPHPSSTNFSDLHQSGPSSALGDTDGSDYMSTSPPKSESIFSAAKNVLHNPNSVLCFHARNVPNIAIEPYLFRILKYCPTTNEVFISLLVYFDRMARLISTPTHTFAIDSYNLHRLVIAGITAASKFFSDVYYTNSRYAKVGGLPLSELNQLELQFLLLNDFRLRVSVEELQRYADQLLLRWNPHASYPSPTSSSSHLSQPLDRIVSNQQQLQSGTVSESNQSSDRGDDDDGEDDAMDYTEKKRELPRLRQHNNDDTMDTSPPSRPRSHRQSLTNDSDSSANSSATSTGSDATLMGY